jgi:type III pantothenate kinase
VNSQASTRAVLDIDMGNSRLKWRFQHGQKPQHGVSDYHQTNWFRIAGLNIHPERVRISSVVRDRRRDDMVRYCQTQWQVTAELAEVQEFCAGVTQAYQHKQRLGVDRWLGMLAAFQQVGACIVVSCGSAVTVDLLLANGQHLGGYIAPGISMMHRSLFSGTDAVKVEAAVQLNDLAPGRDTADAVNKGIVAMIKGLVDLSADIFEREAGKRPQILITGGDGETVQRFLTHDTIYNPYLVLDGLAVALP